MAAVERWLQTELPTFGLGTYEIDVIVQHDGGESRRSSVDEARAAAEGRAWRVEDVSLYAYERDPDSRLSYIEARRVVAAVRQGVIRTQAPHFMIQIKGPIEREVRGFEVLASQFADNLLAGKVPVPETPPAVADAQGKDQAVPEIATPPQAAVAAPPQPSAQRDRNAFIKAVSENPLAATFIGGLLVLLVAAFFGRVF